MNLAHGDARSWARARSASDTPRLGMLEAVACQSHPEVVVTFGDDGTAIAGLLDHKPAGPVRQGAGALLGVLALIGAVAPVAGMAVLGAESYLIDRIDATISVPIAAVAFLIGAVMLLVSGIVWLRSGARWTPVLCALAVVAAVSAGFASVSMPTVSARDDVALDPLLQVPVLGTLVLGVLLAGAVLLRRGHRPPEPEAAEPSRVTMSDRERAARAAQQIPAAERSGIQQDRDDALRILAERGFIDEETLHRALDAPLGTLFTVDATRRTT